MGKSGPGSNDNNEVLHIPQSSRAGASSSDCLMSYLGLSLGEEIYSYAEKQSVYFAAPDWAKYIWICKVTLG